MEEKELRKIIVSSKLDVEDMMVAVEIWTECLEGIVRPHCPFCADYGEECHKCPVNDKKYKCCSEYERVMNLELRQSQGQEVHKELLEARTVVLETAKLSLKLYKEKLKNEKDEDSKET
jgi:hypothetical protein